MVVSCEIGFRKPDAEMFNHVTDRLGVDPDSVVLVDDFEANVDSARRAGWHGILVGSDHSAAMTALAALLAENPRRRSLLTDSDRGPHESADLGRTRLGVLHDTRMAEVREHGEL